MCRFRGEVLGFGVQGLGEDVGLPGIVGTLLGMFT